jgi:hypothetical protein
MITRGGRKASPLLGWMSFGSVHDSTPHQWNSSIVVHLHSCHGDNKLRMQHFASFFEFMLEQKPYFSHCFRHPPFNLLSFCPLILLSLNACTKRFEGSSIRWFPRIQELQILTFHYKECSSYIFYLERHIRFMEYINLYMMVGYLLSKIEIILLATSRP